MGIDDTNDMLVEKMRYLKSVREAGLSEHVVATVRGFNRDRRELYEIPEVQAFCRRLVDLGFISFLDPIVGLNSALPAEARQAWGAYEVWLCGRGRLTRRLQLNGRTLAKELEEILTASNAKAEATVGPYLGPPRTIEVEA